MRATMQQACGVKITTRPQLHTVTPPCSLLAIMRGLRVRPRAKRPQLNTALRLLHNLTIPLGLMTGCPQSSVLWSGVEAAGSTLMDEIVKK